MSPCGKVTPHKEAATSLPERPRVTEEQLKTHSDTRRAYMWGGSEKGAASGERQKTCSFAGWGVQAAKLETPPMALWSCSCWEDKCQITHLFVLWDVQVGKADRHPPPSWVHTFSESFKKKPGLQERRRWGSTGKPKFTCKILQWDVTSKCGWRAPGCNQAVQFHCSWL